MGEEPQPFPLYACALHAPVLHARHLGFDFIWSDLHLEQQHPHHSHRPALERCHHRQAQSPHVSRGAGKAAPTQVNPQKGWQNHNGCQRRRTATPQQLIV